MVKHRLVLIIILFSTFSTIAQEIHQFKNGLFIMAPHRYGREAIYSDQLLSRMFSNSLKTPAAGDVFGTNERGDTLQWQAVTADSLNRLRPTFQRGRGRGGFGGGGGYMYFTYNSNKARTALLNIKGNSAVLVNGEMHTGDPYSSGWLYIPVKLKKGQNEFYARGVFVTASLSFPKQTLSLNTEDPTLPFIVQGKDNSILKAAIVVINSSDKPVGGLQIRSVLAGKEKITALPSIPAMTTRKVSLDLDGSAITTKATNEMAITLLNKGKAADQTSLKIESVNANEHYSSTFTSSIDGSLQYYGVAPQSGKTAEPALFFSVHGAGVEAIGQARAYKPKDWGTLVAPTNRRPRGFNWEDWGRLDALEVLKIAKDTYKPHPQKLYLTGHSMGGHGTWFLGATYPDKWAAIAPCAGYPTLKGYGSADGLVPDSSRSPIEQILIRSSNQSDMIKLATNYKPLGVYIFHGDDDRVVSVNYARQMKKVLSDFHADMSYYEYPGGSHWFGDHSVDWNPIFDFFKWHRRPVDTAVNTIDFMTASPGISSSYYWVSIEQQQFPLKYSRIKLDRNREAGTINGSTENVHLVKLKLNDFASNKPVQIKLDSLATITYTTKSDADSIFLQQQNGKWVIVQKPALTEKGPHRYGTLKDAFNHQMVFVYGTKGSKEENAWSYNKARYDAETWYYRGNGAVDIVSDQEFIDGNFKERGVIVYGNSNSNAAYKNLLEGCPIQLSNNSVTVGSKTWQGDDLAAYFVWPSKDSPYSSVAVIGGTGIKGMNAAYANQYFAGASGFPDFMVFGFDILEQGGAGVRQAGFYDNSWKISEENQVVSK